MGLTIVMNIFRKTILWYAYNFF